MHFQQNQNLNNIVQRVFGQVQDEKLQVFDPTLKLIVLSGLAFFITLVFIAAPFGRFYNSKWGPAISGKLSWLLFESIPWITFSYFFHYPYTLSSPSKPVELNHNNTTWLYFIMFMTHYIHRSLIYTYNAPNMGPNTIIAIVIAVLFNLANGYVNARWITLFGHYTLDTLKIPTVQIGIVLFWLGMYINIKSDYMLFALRQKKEKDETKRYYIPMGFLYNYISCPNYFGEMLEWIGWSLATNSSPAALCFAIFTFCNLFPRALKTHSWYKKTFGDKYPRNRKAVIPGIW